MKSEKALRRRLAKLERAMTEQVEYAMTHNGWPVLFWDKNCVERALLREILGMKYEPFCAADVMAGW